MALVWSAKQAGEVVTAVRPAKRRRAQGTKAAARRIEALGIGGAEYVRSVEVSIRAYVHAAKINDDTLLLKFQGYCGTIADILEVPKSQRSGTGLEDMIASLRLLITQLEAENQTLRAKIEHLENDKQINHFNQAFLKKMGELSAHAVSGSALVIVLALSNMVGFVNIALGPEAAATVQECLLGMGAAPEVLANVGK